jgi:L-iditol 2-dehydrogenase
MKAAVLRGVHDLRLEDLPEPSPAPDEVLIKIKASGICGTDVHMWEGTNDEGTFPFIPGHEWAGEVVEVGSKIKTLKAGDGVVGDPFIPCHVCSNCKEGLAPAMCSDPLYYGFTWDTPGGMTEYIVSREERLHKVPSNLSYDEAALVEGVSVPYRGIWGVGGGAAPHDRVVVFGGGPIGIWGMQACKASGATTFVVEPQPLRRKMAQEQGADGVVDPSEGSIAEQLLDLTEGRGATLILECSGADSALAATIDVVAKGGRIVLIGHSIGRRVPIEVGKSIWKDVSFIGSCDAPWYFPKTLDYMARKLADITAVVTHRFPLAKIQEAFEVGKDTNKAGKILVMC